LNNLADVPRDIFEFVSMPLWVEAADGSPVRAVAMLR
jgi:kynurenine formamidase